MKKIKAVVRLQIPAGKANPAPPVGPALAQHGINLMQFCKEYNARTAGQVGNIIPAEITIFQDGSFRFVLKTPPTPDLLRKAAGVERGSSEPNRLKEIAQLKMKDLNAVNLEGAMRQIEGTARSMGIAIAD